MRCDRRCGSTGWCSEVGVTEVGHECLCFEGGVTARKL